MKSESGEFLNNINIILLRSAESNTLNLQLSQVTGTKGKQCRRVDFVVFQETLNLRSCFFPVFFNPTVLILVVKYEALLSGLCDTF